MSVIGSTGSIGTQTLEVLRHLVDQFHVVALAGGSNLELLGAQAREFGVSTIVTPSGIRPPTAPRSTTILAGAEGLREIASLPEADIVVVASSGHTALEPMLSAVDAGKIIALANKESIVCAGEFLIPRAAKTGAKIRPVDSEHSAIWQSIGNSPSPLSRLILTASGGPFRDRPLESLKHVTVAEALKHPNWDMGGKITIDSATMMNKGLEVIEAHWLFDMPYEKIDILIHPESIIHSFAEFEDMSQIAQLSLPDMRLPIQFALTFPAHLPGLSKRLDLDTIRSMSFFRPDLNRFPALALAREVGQIGGTLPTVMSAADDLAVDAFIHGRIPFDAIVELVRNVVSEHSPGPVTSLEDIASTDEWARQRAEELIAIT